jgi:hypothetical protein
MSIGSMAEHAAARDALGIRSASDFAGLDRRVNTSGFPDAADLMVSGAAEFGNTNPYRAHERPGYEPRLSGILAAELPTSIGGIRYRGIEGK